MFSAMTRYRTAISTRIEEILDSPAPFPLGASIPLDVRIPLSTPGGRSADSSSLTPHDFLAPARALAHGGKRTRALFALAGWQAGMSIDAAALDSCSSDEMPIELGTALELYQLSALIHDDVLDEASMRRGVPTAHKAFAQYHRNHSLLGSSEEYGTKVAILLGDYVLTLAAYTLETSLNRSSINGSNTHSHSTVNNSAEVPTHIDSDAAQAVRSLFHSMTTEVAFGQYIDVHAEFSPLADSASEAIHSALTVLHHKAARYSVTVPTLLGALYARAELESRQLSRARSCSSVSLSHSQPNISTHQQSPTSTSTLLRELECICSPLGEAFQLRDDMLGIFGEPEVTGKPAGDDICEGKRTVLLALTRKMASQNDRALIDSHLGHSLNHDTLKHIRCIIKRSGAYQEHEDMIKAREHRVQEALTASSYHVDVLADLAKQLSGRTS